MIRNRMKVQEKDKELTETEKTRKRRKDGMKQRTNVNGRKGQKENK